MYEIYTSEIFMQCSEAFTETSRIFCWKDYKIQGKQFLSPKFDFFTGWSNHVRWQGRLNSLEASSSSLGFKSNKENWWSANSSSLLSACQININHVQWLLWIFEIIQTWISIIQQTSWNLDSSTTFSTAFGFHINLSVSEFWRRILLIILQ